MNKRFSYLQQPPGFYRRVFLLALPVVLQNLITTSLVLDAPVVIVCIAMTSESAFKLAPGLFRLHSGKWIHDVTAE